MGRVLAPFLALGLVVLVVSLLGGSEIVTGRVRPEAGAAPATTRTTTIFLTQPSAGSKDARVWWRRPLRRHPRPLRGPPAGPIRLRIRRGPPSRSPGRRKQRLPRATPVHPPASDEEGSTYTVVAGDTPYSIAQAFGVSTKDLMDLNGIDDPYDLRIGTVLRIPAK